MNEMEASCSFKLIVGSACSYDQQDRIKLFEVVPLVSCNKNVQGHKSAWCFAGVKSESELNLARAGIFFSALISLEIERAVQEVGSTTDLKEDLAFVTLHSPNNA